MNDSNQSSKFTVLVVFTRKKRTTKPNNFFLANALKKKNY